MECPHILQSSTVALTLKDLAAILKKPIQCSGCKAKSSIWICVTCGQLNCGRYVKGCALAHYRKTTNNNHQSSKQSPHSVCLEINELSVFCYACDDFIVNDTNDTKLDRMRAVITKHQEQQSPGIGNGSEATNPPVTKPVAPSEEASVSSREKRAQRRRTVSSSNLSSTRENDQPAKRARLTSATARPQAPPRSSQKSAEQTQRLKHLVGLRNLGNTCFMSAVLQSLGNINEFCSVLQQLPSLEDQLLRKSNKKEAAQSDKKGSSDLKPGKNVGVVSSSSTDGAIMTEELRKVLVALSSNYSSIGGSPEKKKASLNRSIATTAVTSISASNTRKVISPESLFHVIWKVVPRFRGYQQQDAHEFLRYMLDRLHTELLTLIPATEASELARKHPHLARYFKQLSQNPTLTYRRSGSPTITLNGRSGGKVALNSSHSLVTHMFGGTLQSEVTCLSCRASSKKHDPFLDLSVDIPSTFLCQRKAKAAARTGRAEEGGGGPAENSSGGGNQSTPKSNSLRLHDCLEKFVEVEELADSERFFCNNCKNKQRATKKFWIRRLPNVLCLHLKRFRWSPYSRTKLDNHVEFPLHGLDMSPYLLSNLHGTRCSNSGSHLYDLAAVIVHHGTGAGSGHYTAFVVKDNHWFHFNDSTVLATDHETVLKSKAYILFYIQRELKKHKAP